MSPRFFLPQEPLNSQAIIWISHGKTLEKASFPRSRPPKVGAPVLPLNVVWICVDDYAYYVSGAYGNRLAKTPNLDRFAENGIRFDRAYCACPLSTPSRMSFLTGRYPHSIQVTLTPSRLPRNELTLGSYLRSAGYETFGVGKTHYYDPLIREFDRCVDLREHEEYLASKPQIKFPWKAEVLGPWRPFAEPASDWLNSQGLPYAADADMPDTFFTDHAVRFLKQPRSKPFFLWVGYYVTHAPFRFPIEFQGMFDPNQFPVPGVTSEDRAVVPQVFRDLTDAEKQGIQASYYTSSAYMDRNLGRILDALSQSPHATTLVIFNSDHGYLLGQHGRFEKHCCYEEAVRCAFVIQHPGQTTGRATDALVSLVDVVPTVLELCDIEIPAGVQGTSFASLMKGEVEHHHEHVVSVYPDNAEAMVRTKTWKLIYSAGNRLRRDGYSDGDRLPGKSIKLFNMINDPDELFNLAGRARYQAVVETLLELIANHLRATVPKADLISDDINVHSMLAQFLGPKFFFL